MQGLALVAIATLVLPLLLDQVDAQTGKLERSVTMNVTNKKTGITQSKVWDLSAYTFETNVPIDVPNFQVRKIKQTFGTDSFSFTLQTKSFEGQWLHFTIEILGTPPVGRGLSVKFV